MDNLPCEYVIYVLTVIDNISHALFGRSLLLFSSRVRFVSPFCRIECPSCNRVRFLALFGMMSVLEVFPNSHLGWSPIIIPVTGIPGVPSFLLPIMTFVPCGVRFSWVEVYLFRFSSDDFGCLISLTLISVLDIHSPWACCSLALIPVFGSHVSSSLLPSNR